MGKTVAKVVGVIAGAAALFIPGLQAFGVTFFAGSALAFTVPLTALLSGIAAVGISIGFRPEFDFGESGRQLAENLHITSNPVAIRGVAFGRTGIAGQVLFRKNIKNAGETPDELLLILGLAGYPATALEKFWFNGELLFDGESTTGPGAITSGKFANEIWVWFRTGEEVTEAFPGIASLSPEWNVKTRRLRGIPAIAIRLKVTEKVEGRIEPLAQFKGAKLYDPRLDSSVPGGSGTHDFDDPSTWSWSENPKLAELLYLRGGTINDIRIFGMGKPRAAIDLENFASEANICEEQIGVVAGGTINRYTCNGLLIPGRDHRQNLNLLLSASAGIMDASGGIYRTFAGAWRAPSMTLSEPDIDGAPTEIRLQKDPAEEINVITGSFADPNDRWRVKEYPARFNQASIDQVGENAITVDLPFTIDHRMAQRIIKIQMFRENAARLFGANYWLRALALQPGDIVTQTYTRYAVDAETFRVNFWGVEAAEDQQGAKRLIVPMQLTEERQEWFDWVAGSEEKQSNAIAALPTIDRNPKITLLEGATAFEGPFPPANPKVGWLWRDTDVNIVFRWNGAAWVDFATETKTADQINYLSGASVESLEPAEAAADATAPRIGANGLINGGFETGTFEAWDSIGPTTISSASKRSGSFSALMDISGTSGGSAVGPETIRYPSPGPGERLLVQAFANRSEGGGLPNRGAFVSIQFFDASGVPTSGTLSIGSASELVSGWQLIRGIRDVPANSATFLVRLGSIFGAGAVGAWFWDDISWHVVPKHADIDLGQAGGAVDTSRIDSEAVTAVQSAYVASHSETGGVGTSWLTITTEAQPVAHTIQATASCDAWHVSANVPFMQIIATPLPGGPPIFGGVDRVVQGTASPGERLTFQLDFPAAASTQYIVRLAASNGSSGSLQVRDATLRVVNIKK